MESRCEADVTGSFRARMRKCKRNAIAVEDGKRCCYTHSRAGQAAIAKKVDANFQKRMRERGKAWGAIISATEGWSGMDDFPMDGTVVEVQIRTLMVWAPYDRSSKQYKKGIKGRWLQISKLGSLETAQFEPVAWRRPEVNNISANGQFRAPSASSPG